MSDQNLKLNSLSRFSKQSPRLILEEYSNCEVPAGCGGVVLRWRDPTEPIPMIVRFFYGNSRPDLLTLDGTDEKFRSKILVTSGRHTLALVFRDVDPAFAFVLLAAKLDENYVRVLHLEGDTRFVSIPDGSWRYTLEPPDDNAWQQPDFDDSSWLPMVEQPFGPLPKNYGGDIHAWTHDLTERGARGLGIDTKSTPSLKRQIKSLLGQKTTLPAVYIRKTFTVSKSSREEESHASR